AGSIRRNYAVMPNGMEELRACLGRIQFAQQPYVNLEPQDEDQSITPGYYGPVTIKRGRTLTLEGPGDFVFSTLDVDSQGTLEVLGGARIYVNGGMRLIGDFESDTDQTLLMNNSTNGIFIDGAGYAMTIVAPDADVIINSERTFTGAIYAQNI